MGWMGTGHKTTEEINKDLPERRDKGPRRVWIPHGETRRYLFLEDDPQTCWEHKFRLNGRWDNWEPCVTRNKLPNSERGCPMCIAKESDKDYPLQWASYTGFYTVIQMTPWFTDKNHAEINYRRQIYACLRGSDENPGVLRELERITQKEGRLRGLVFDIERRAKKDESCGTRFELVEKIDPKDIEKYGKKMLAELAERENPKRPDDKQLDLDKLWKWHPWQSLDFEEVIKPRPYDELVSLFPPRKRSSKKKDEDNSSGGGYDDGGEDDDDIPY